MRNGLTLILFFGICVLASGCQDSATIWSAEVRSPDGNWLAKAHTEQYGGPGTASVQTSVYLRRINGSQPPVEILELSNDSAYPSGITSVDMNWVTPSRLDFATKGTRFSTSKWSSARVSTFPYGIFQNRQPRLHRNRFCARHVFRTVITALAAKLMQLASD